MSSEALFVGVGIVIAYWFGYGMSFVGGGVSWRLPVPSSLCLGFPSLRDGSILRVVTRRLSRCSAMCMTSVRMMQRSE
jgi:hypothetical protein